MKNGIYIIGEIGQAHDGSLGQAHSYIDALAETGVDAVKFQVHIAEAESSIYESFRCNFSFEDATRLDYWRRIAFTKEQWKDLQIHCHRKNINFVATPFSNAAVDLLEENGVDRYKVGSGEVDNPLLLRKIVETGKPIILSSGMSSVGELDVSVDYLRRNHCEFSLLQCTTSYPTEPSQWGLNMIAYLKNRYTIPIGFSDHSGDVYACLAAASLGAEILEFHTVFDKRMFGPDSTSSITIDNVAFLVKGVRQIETALNYPVGKCPDAEQENLKAIFGKSLAVNKNLPTGHLLSFSDLESKKPKGHGIAVKDYESVVGKKLNKDINQWTFLNVSDLTDA